MYPYNTSLKDNSKELRKEMTPEEKELWYNFLKKLPFPVKRQKIILNFILDFYIPKVKVAIEIDGRQHLEKEHLEKDSARDKILSEYGITVWRYPNESIDDNFTKVCNDILNRLGLSYDDLKTI